MVRENSSQVIGEILVGKNTIELILRIIANGMTVTYLFLVMSRSQCFFLPLLPLTLVRYTRVCRRVLNKSPRGTSH